ncbi:uncharacterized protein LOC129584179 [Paramacrobiotus metropolitanus]|uniref:uncharacterized protein LOC129584179 n=1 Tax=Paramacrobiotus metropolitanus TaxID=2943436 RepID=UPI0024461EF9|nr:uncharacterized protein LOC129584179 [Paramacrobiotus metropolitanus]
MEIVLRSLIMILSVTVILVHTQCPTLHSGLCFVDCTNASLYNIACEDIKGAELYGDLKVYVNSDQPISLSVWDSPLTRIGNAILNPVSNQMVRLKLDNLLDLQWFPELWNQAKLVELVIMNSPKLDEMPLELLPANIQSITLFRVGITDFVNDFDETPQIPSMEIFIIAQSRINYIQSGFFDSFPNLIDLRIIDAQLFVNEVLINVLRTKKPLTSLQIRGNAFITEQASIKREWFLEDIISNTLVGNGALADFADNSLPIGLGVLLNLENLKRVKKFSLRGNTFSSFAMLSQRLTDFSQLEELDLSDTGLFVGSGMFAGLKNLKILRLSGNHFHDLTLVNIFKGCQASSLQKLDLSGNDLELLPAGMETLAKSLTDFNLSRNKLRLQFIFTYQHIRRITPLFMFSKLRSLDVSYNNLKIFIGAWLSDLKELTDLNIACNRFQVVTKEYFRNLPRSLKTLNMTFCADDSTQRPEFGADVFSTLPSISRLILQRGMLKETFLQNLKTLRIHDSLKELDLSYNVIAFWPDNTTMLHTLHELQTLKLGSNQMQSIGPRAFAVFVFLQELDLSHNRLIAIGKDDFAGLHNLRTLTLADNDIINIDADAFTPLRQLRALYLGGNKDVGLTKMFPLGSKAGKKLIHLGLQQMPVECIPADTLQQLERLKWLYLNQSQSVNMDFGSFRRMQEVMTVKYPFKLFAFREPTLADIGCESYERWDVVYNRSARFVVTDTHNNIPQHMTINIPDCHMEGRRRLKQRTQHLPYRMRGYSGSRTVQRSAYLRESVGTHNRAVAVEFLITSTDIHHHTSCSQSDDGVGTGQLDQSQNIPELRDQFKLKRLRIMNSPKLTDLPLELLPPNIESLTFYRVGITALFNDFEETLALQYINEFVYDGGILHYIQPAYFTVFPNLTTLKIRGTNFTMAELSQDMMRTVRPLKKLHLTGNDFQNVPFSNQEKVLEGTTINAYLEIGADMDFSGNNLPVSRMAAVNFGGVRNARFLSLRDNRFDDYISTSRLFQNFSYLETLDLTHTYILKSVASFSGLPRLKSLRIAGNLFEELTVSNIFQNSESINLDNLDVSDNNLQYLPKGMTPIVNSLRVLNLAGNKLDLEAISKQAQKIQLTQFSIFSKLQSLDLSRNKLTSLNGSLFSHIPTLKTLHIGCNYFRRIHKGFFEGLPSSLNVLNLTMCYNSTKIVAKFDDDAFSTLPANLRTLILAQGDFSSRVFFLFKHASIPKLRELDLSYNSIVQFPGDSGRLEPIATVRILKLRANKLQSLGGGRLAVLAFLQELDVSRNAISAIGKDDFKGLSNLKVLTLAGNQIIDFEEGSLKPLVSLEAMYYGENMFTDFDRIFSGGPSVGRNLKHLGIQELPVTCIPGMLFMRLPSLKWMYLNSSRAVNLDAGSFRRIQSVSIGVPFKLFAFRKPNLWDLGCTSYEQFDDVYNRSSKFIVNDRYNQVPQHMVIRFPSCHMDAPRRLKFYTDEVVC